MMRFLEDEKCNDDMDVTGPVKEVWWTRAWIPVASRYNGDFYCIDLDPAEGGRSGQVIRFFHEEGARYTIAPSYRDWLNDVAMRFEDGRLVYDEEWGISDEDDEGFCQDLQH